MYGVYKLWIEEMLYAIIQRMKFLITENLTSFMGIIQYGGFYIKHHDDFFTHLWKGQIRLPLGYEK